MILWKRGVLKTHTFCQSAVAKNPRGRPMILWKRGVLKTGRFAYGLLQKSLGDPL